MSTNVPQTTPAPELTLPEYLLFEAILEGNHCGNVECTHRAEQCECWQEFCELRGSVSNA